MPELIRLFDTLPASADTTLKAELPKIGANILARQKDDVSIRTGDLWRGLSVQTLDDGLKVRVGLVNVVAPNGRSGSLYYGRFVEYGRKGQTVLVQRRRRVDGRLRSSRGRKIAGDLVATYKMRVGPAPARPFVNTPATEAASIAGVEAIADAVQSKMKE
jgi:hypothetical protein